MKKFSYLLYIYLITSILFVSGCTNAKKPNSTPATFVGSKNCIECHESEFKSWEDSDHAFAMDTAIESTVLGDFNDATIEYQGFKSKMYKKNGKFFVHTLGPEGVPGDFQIAYTFGYKPLQQYLIPFDNGRLQCLQITWDTKQERWYHLADSVYKGDTIKPDDWLYWTNNGQNWNGMCAECHSTNLRKNYNPDTHAFNTTWSEINVSCEACHGPGSEHLIWANSNKDKKPDYDNKGLVVATNGISPKQLIGDCAYCHARRSSFGDFIYPHGSMYNIMAPQLPIEPNYYIDGQIKEEDYVYSSFTQSRMYHENVACNNCHDVHSLKVKFNGKNQLCEQCHDKKTYDTPKHHFHKLPNQKGEPLIVNNGEKTIQVGEGSSCINCHMPGSYYMGVDFRRDHSMRIPRPDLTIKLGTPNACNSQCHTNKSAAWADSFIVKWYGDKRRHQFGETFAKATKNDTTSFVELVKIINDSLTTPIVKAAAVMYIGNAPLSPERQQVIFQRLHDPNPMVRNEALKAFIPSSMEDKLNIIKPFLTDSIKLVRLTATIRFSEIPASQLDSATKIAFNKNVKEYINTMNYSADFAPSRHNMGLLYSNLGDNAKAKENFEEALRIDNKFYPSKINLALLSNSMGNNKKAVVLFKEVINDFPELSESYYYLGLLEAEMGDYTTSANYLKSASERNPDNPNIFINLAKVSQYLNNNSEAEKAYLRAHELDPENVHYFSQLIGFYIKTQNISQAENYLTKWIKLYPNDDTAKEILTSIRSKI